MAFYTKLFTEKSIIKTIPLTGNSMYLRERKEGGYIGTFRNMHPQSPNARPCLINTTVIAHFDDDFNVVSQFDLKDNLHSMPRYINYTSGLEDIRIIGDNHIIAGSLDTNPDWLCGLVYAEFSHETHELTKMVRLYIDGVPKTNQKNWTVLNKREGSGSGGGDIYHMLYWYNPFTVISLDTTTGKAECIKKYDVSLFSNMRGINMHGGACIFLERYKQYLVLVRCLETRSGTVFYNNSMWMLLDEKYELCGLSKIGLFNFETPDVEPIKYELCISFILKGDYLYLPLTFNEYKKYVYKISLTELMNTFYKVNNSGVSI